MQQPRSSTIRLDQHFYHANHTLIIQLAGLWGLNKLRFLLLHCRLEFDQNIRTSSISKCHLSAKKIRVYDSSAWSSSVWISGSSLSISVIRWLYRHLSTRRSIDRFPCRLVHKCIFSIDSLKYVFETGPFHESTYGPQQVHECMETPQHQNNTF